VFALQQMHVRCDHADFTTEFTAEFTTEFVGSAVVARTGATVVELVYVELLVRLCENPKSCRYLYLCTGKATFVLVKLVQKCKD